MRQSAPEFALVDEAPWSRFRRLLLGSVVEALLAEGVAIVSGSIAFEHDRARRRGHLIVGLEGALGPVQLAALQARLRTIWPELLALAVGAERQVSGHDLSVDATAEHLVVRFDAG